METNNITIDELKDKKISFISLGCDKNRVDLEEMMFSLKNFGFEFSDIENSNIVLINTCAFILPARKEAIDNILEMVERKKSGKLEKIFVTGCLNQRYLDELKNYIPEVDVFIPLKENKNIVEIIANAYGVNLQLKKKETKQLTITPSHYAYLKIADGCNNGCSYCTIPRIRGRYRSVPFEEVIERAKYLVSQGAKELILVAQDVTRYGIDLYKKFMLIDLLKELSKIKNLKWIRLHYLYPETVTEELLEEISNNPKVCKYLDIPLQHIDNEILKSMNRRALEDDVRTLISNIREKYPNIVLRSTFIIGYPHETRKKFKKLIHFLKEFKLEQVGFFAFSREEGTKAFYLKHQIPEFIKRHRVKVIQKVQAQIAKENNLKQIGQIVEVLVDEFDSEKGVYIARTNTQSPDVDFNVVLDGNLNLEPGLFYKAKILNFESYSFVATTEF
ncbi:MAG: 30S ribosomal protein S12 methylthiotransferase RimO [Clostridia bacterium]|nr:30S ribosomal protein S12 methylthiotransferase RimO [Clostridia bacterium]